MTNAKVYPGFDDDKKVEEHCPRLFTKILSLKSTVNHANHDWKKRQFQTIALMQLSGTCLRQSQLWCSRK